MKLVSMGEHRRSKIQAKKKAEGNSVISEFFMEVHRSEMSQAQESISLHRRYEISSSPLRSLQFSVSLKRTVSILGKVLGFWARYKSETLPF